MPRLYPLRALRYTTDDGDLSTRIAPPYDVLDEGPKQALLADDPNNIVVVDLPVTPPKTLGPPAAYRQAGQRLRQWIDTGIVRRDDRPAIYAYEQQYDMAGRTYQRRGLFATLEVQPFNQPAGIWAHEKTIRGGLDDRLHLMNATDVQLSPVFGIFDDPDGRAITELADCFDRSADFFGTTANDGVIHRCWTVCDPARIDRLQKFFADTDVFIADGHHRYTTALNYAEQHPERSAAQQCLFVLVALQDPGMIVLPYHRVLCGLTGFSMQRLIEQEARNDRLILRHFPGPLRDLPDALPSAGHHGMGLFDPSDGSAWLVATTQPDPLEANMPDRPACWRTLDAAVVQHLLVERILQPLGADAPPITYRYTADLDELVAMTQSQPDRLGVIVQPTALQSVLAVARAGQVMPAKSTYFYPKLATGLVLHPVGDSDR